MPSPVKDWPHVCRIIWLCGGIVAVNEPGTLVKIKMGFNGPTCYEFQLLSYASLFHMLAQLGFTVMGATYVVDLDEAEGIRPPEFRAWVSGVRAWRVPDLHQQWGQVAYAAAQKNEMVLMDVASRIASELVYSEMRLLNLAEAYSTQLSGKAKQGAINEFERFDDLNSRPIYLAIHALFWELAVLRDNLAEFAAKILFAFDNVTKFQELIKRLPQSKWQNDDLAIDLLTAGGDGQAGWIATFTAYRNLFTHSAPMEQAAGIAYATLDQMTIKGGQTVPQLYYPLPRDVRELSKRRSSGVLYKDLDELIAASSGRNSIRETEPDALYYLHVTLGQMALLTERLIQRSPIAPEMIHLTDSDIIGSAIRQASK